MLFQDPIKWKKDTLKKFVSFCEKSPVLFDFKVFTDTNTNKEGLFITSFGETELSNFFAFDYSLDPKTYIHLIKEYFFSRTYPYFTETIEYNDSIDIKDMAILLEKGKKLEDIKNIKKTSIKHWIIDRVILWKNIIILTEVDKDKNPISDKSYRYKYDGCLVIFLKDLREGKYKSAEEIGKYIFEHSILINEI